MPSPLPFRSWSRPSSPRSSSPRTPPCGAQRRSPSRPSGSRGSDWDGPRGRSSARSRRCATEGKELVVLDSSDPDYVRAALQDKLDRTVVVVSSKSGSTVETDSQKRVYEGAFTDAGIDPTERIVIVTDPGSPLDKSAREAGYRVVNADPD